jgi:hypothetical protein
MPTRKRSFRAATVTLWGLLIWGRTNRRVFLDYLIGEPSILEAYCC